MAEGSRRVGAGAAVAVLARRPPEAVAKLHEAAPRVTPTTLAQEHRLEVVPALRELFPEGLQRGSTVGVHGCGALSLGLAVAAGPVQAGSWMAAVGCEDVCLVGAEQAGVVLHRLVLVQQPPRSAWGAAVAALVDAFDVVVLSGTTKAPARDTRRLLSRARERGSVIIDVGGVWAEAHDTVLDVAHQSWSGLGNGHGVLSSRQVQVAVSGRRGVRPRQVPLWLPSIDSTPRAFDPAAAHAGADIDSLVAVEHQVEVEQVEERTA